ncbi:MAG: Holliday junction branch migration protein RuvA [Alphaproteobacteria bacterium]|nr:Holliday junction branch migration protein RuvA [Alphaproteobacteria bacterium]MDE2339477.1 Holliday junction branch migration protein RuvA [Alphaproteobacteria bacterium]
MIARLSGQVAETSADYAVIEVNGVGYLVLASARTLGALEQGAPATLHTEMQVREDAITLFGFASGQERDWFRLLTGVQGVGGKVALAILSVLEPDALALAISAQDKAMVARANGVGPKLAERIVRELKDRVGALALPVTTAALPSPRGAAGSAGLIPDALSALANLGFKPAEASVAVSQALEELGNAATLDALVRLALRKVGQ